MSMKPEHIESNNNIVPSDPKSLTLGGSKGLDISVVIPLYNEDESLSELYEWIERVMKENGYSFEVIFVNDGSTDHSWDVIEELNRQAPDQVKGIKFRRKSGKSPALYSRFEEAEGDVVITLAADLLD